MLSAKTKTLTIASVTESSTGTYTCLVTDGKTKANCKPFTLTATKIVSIQLTWSHPVSRADGSALPVSQIAGYEIFRVVDGAALYVETVGPVTSRTIGNLKPDVYQFALITIDSYGFKSSLSAPTQATTP
jgi:hypothetical protein